MKTLAIYLQTTSNLNLTEDQKHLLEGATIDRRLKKAESIKAHLESDDYMLKKVSFQMRHAEFGKIHQLSTFDGRDTDVAHQEEAALHLINVSVRGVERLIVFDAEFTIPFILKRAMLTGYEAGLRSSLYSLYGTATTMVIDIKGLWTRQNKEYSGMTLNMLSKYMGITSQPRSAGKISGLTAFPQEAERVYEIYERMVGYLCS